MLIRLSLNIYILVYINGKFYDSNVDKLNYSYLLDAFKGVPSLVSTKHLVCYVL